mgnify:CR=1 FL=1
MLDGSSAGAGAAAAGGATGGAGATQGSSRRSRRRGKHLRSTAEGDAISASEHAAVPGMVSVGVQSMYRDGEAQTEAYTPDFVLRAGSDPEVLHLAHMTAGGRVGSRLPAGVAEVEYIEEMRERRAIEAALPPLTDEASFEHRKRLMEELELRAWTWHEAEVDTEGERRVQAVLDAVHEREAAREWVSEQRAESVRQRVEADKDRALTTIQKKRIKTLRKLSKARAAHEEHVDALTGRGGAGAGGAASGGAHNRGRRSQRDIIGEYANYSSKIYAPVAHSGHGTISGGMDEGIQHRVEAHVGDTSSFAALTAVEATLRPSTLLARTKPPAAPIAKSAAQRADASVDRDLARVHNMLRTAKAEAAGTKLDTAPAPSAAPAAGGRLNLPLPASSLERDEVPAWRQPKEKVLRPGTPTFDEEDEDAEAAAADNAVLLLQKLLRGRAVQNMMFEGKERRLELIEEMRQDLLDDEQLAEVSRQERERQAAAAVRVAQEAAVDTAAGEVASAALDFLSKELVRQGEATRVAAVVAHAEDTRRRREVEEGGQRQAQEAVQAKADDVYRQVRAVHADTARGLVASTLAAAVSGAASAAAQAAVRAERSAGGAAAGDGSNTAVVKSLVGSFVLPEAQRAAQESKRGGGDTDAKAGGAAAASAFAMIACKPLAMGTGKK